MGWVVNTTPRPLYPRERPGTHCIGGWVGPRAGLDGRTIIALTIPFHHSFIDVLNTSDCPWWLPLYFQPPPSVLVDTDSVAPTSLRLRGEFTQFLPTVALTFQEFNKSRLNRDTCPNCPIYSCSQFYRGGNAAYVGHLRTLRGCSGACICRRPAAVLCQHAGESQFISLTIYYVRHYVKALQNYVNSRTCKRPAPPQKKVCNLHSRDLVKRVQCDGMACTYRWKTLM